MVSRALAVALVCLALAEALPARAGELIHPYPPIGPVEVAGTPAANKALRAVQRMAMPPFTDVLAIHVANALQASSGEPFTIVRKSRQGGAEATEIVARAPGGGRTLLLAMDVPKLRGVARVAVMPYVFVVRNDSRFGDIAQLLSHLKTTSERFLTASAGERTVAHAALAMLRSRYRLPIEPVSFRGGYAALQALGTNEVNAALVPLPSVMPYMAGGRLKVLPTGKSSEFEVADAFHLFAPLDVPNITIARLNTALASNLVTPDAQTLFSSLGFKLEHRPAGVAR